MVAILMMSAKLATLSLLKVKVFRNKGYEVIIYVHERHVTQTILQMWSRNQSLQSFVIQSFP